MIQASEITQRIKQLPVFPQAPMRLAALMASGKCGAADFEKVVKPDPGLTANVLRLANSAYFGFSRRIGSALDAITLLGLKRVYDVATMAAMEHVLPPRLPGYEMSSDAYWQHCVAVAVLAEHLAKQCGRQVPALVFTAGLMHDIGKLVLGEFLALHATPVLERLRRDGVTLIRAEREILGLDHAELGHEVGTAWQLPEAVVTAARWHHSPGAVPEGVDGSCVDYVHIADALAHSLGLGADVGELCRPLDLQALDRLKLTASALESVAGSCLGAIEGLTGLRGAAGKGDKA